MSSYSTIPRLLSPLGLPKLRRTASEQLGKKLKGKGHEYSDAKRILNFYQLWADDLYRKANFRDTISIVEKLGHTKRVQIARNQYLDDYLPKNIPQEIAEEIARQENANNERAQNDDDDLYTEGPRKQGTSDQMQGENGGSLFLGGVDSDDEPSGAQPDDAELDALLEEEESEARMLDAGPTAPKAIGKQSTGDDEFDEFGDGLEAIDDWDEVMDGAGPSMQSQSQTADVGARASIFGGTTTEKPSNAGTAPPDDVDDEDALEALYGF